MNTVIMILQIIAIFGVPVLLIKFKDAKIIKPVGTIGAAYVLGLIVALIVFLINKAGAGIALNSDVGEIGSHAAIGIAIPLLLFNSDLSKARKLSKRVLISFATLTVSVLIVTAVTFYIYGRTLEDGDILSAMAIGLYTGGTPNLNAIGNIFGLDSTTIGIANFSDMLIGGVFYMFLLLAAKPLLKKFLKTPETAYFKDGAAQENTVPLENNKDVYLKNKKLLRNFLIAFGMTAVGGVIGIVVWLILGAKQGRMTDYLVPAVMITVTVLGIIGSFNKKISSVKENSSLGQYFILVFSFALSMSVNIESIKSNFLSIMLLYGIITVGAFVLHIIISKFTKTDVDCALITLTAGIYGPAFVPALTKQYGNDALTVPGLICGSIGYAAGTFLGILTGLLFAL
jgi:uncharacterized membrane protein